ncbi:AT hook [Macleaya cordata]|uniref:AT hook n=1 Tax=Macleaya cordata TaxID=56857 RepID=A0A200Q812_MACCD|nr:AT hook [Macleaya cordata]
MSQENQTMNSASAGNMPVKRKRGRPRKNESLIRGDKASATPITDAVKRNRYRKVDPKAGTDDPMVGQVVSGVLDGSFDAGYLLTVRVGNTNRVLRGVVFEPHLTVPISGANDIAPQVKMLNRIQVSLEKPAQVHGSANRVEQKSKSPVKLHPRNEGSVPTKVSSPVKHVPQVASEVLLPHIQTDIPLSSKGVSNDVNHVPQATPQALQQVEIRTENQVGQVYSQATENQMQKRKVIEVSPKDEPVLLPVTTESQAVTTQLVAELSHMLQDNQTALNSDIPVDIQNKSLIEIPRTDETLCLNGRPSEVMTATARDAESEPKTNGPVQIIEIDGHAAEQSVLPKAASELQMSNSSVLSRSEDIFIGDGVSLVQSQSDLFGNTDSD